MDVLRHCLPPSVRRTLDELPESLDETYERVLREIKKPNREHARRVLQCLVVAIRPLRVEELAEVLALDFGDQDEGMPKLNPNWRWQDEEQALLMSCSSLITISESDESRILQFSHHSVKEFLTSSRFAASSGDISRYHVDVKLAHAVLARACMSILLRSDERIEDEESGVENGSPLVLYAAEHWVAHAQGGEVSSCLRKAMEQLFDVDEPYFANWLRLHDIDTHPLSGSAFHQFTPYSKSRATPLYYSALCGFQDLVKHIFVNDPKLVNATGGYYVTPLVAALAGGHFQTAKFLYDNGADPNVRGRDGRTLLHAAAVNGEFEIIQVLLKYKADVNARDAEGKTPLHFASERLHHRGSNIALSSSGVGGGVTRLLLEHGADIDMRANDRSTPLHEAAQHGRVEVVQVLLEHIENLGGKDLDRETPFQVGSKYVNARDAYDNTPLHYASQGHWHYVHYPGDSKTVLSLPNIVRLLLEHGADVNARGDDRSTPLHKAAQYGRVEVVSVLLEHVVNLSPGDDSRAIAVHEYVNVQDAKGKTPLHCASEGPHTMSKIVALSLSSVTRLLLKHGADLNARRNDRSHPLHDAALYGWTEVVRVLLEHAVDVDAADDARKIAFHEYINARDAEGNTPLHCASAGDALGGDNIARSNIVRLLLQHGANANARENNHSIALHLAAQYGRVEVLHVLLEHVAIPGAVDDDSKAALLGYVNAQDEDGNTPLHFASEGFYQKGRNISLSFSNVARLLLEYGADVNAQGTNQSTPLHVAAQCGTIEVVRVLLEHVANLAAEDDGRKTAFEAVSEYVNARDAEGKTPLNLVFESPHWENPRVAQFLPKVSQLLLKHHSTPVRLAAQYRRADNSSYLKICLVFGIFYLFICFILFFF